MTELLLLITMITSIVFSVIMDAYMFGFSPLQSLSLLLDLFHLWSVVAVLGWEGPLVFPSFLAFWVK